LVLFAASYSLGGEGPKANKKRRQFLLCLLGTDGDRARDPDPLRGRRERS
jgi:hypothetical protein